MGLIHGSDPLKEQYSCLENPMDRGVWQATSIGPQRVPGISVVKNLPANARDTGLILDPGRSQMLQGS